jgi:hypothetical protein
MRAGKRSEKQGKKSCTKHEIPQSTVYCAQVPLRVGGPQILSETLVIRRTPLSKENR